MESIIYKDLFTKENVTRWKSEVDYVLVCTYRHAILTDQLRGALIHPLNSTVILDLLHSATFEDYDTIPLEPSPEITILYSLKLHHSLNAVKAWNVLLITMNFTQQEMRAASYINAFWRNAYLIKPAVLDKLSQLMRIAMDVAEDPNEKSLQRFIGSNAKYQGGDPIVAYKVYLIALVYTLVSR